MICGEYVHYSTHTLAGRLAEELLLPFYSGSNTRSSFTLFPTENDSNGGSERKVRFGCFGHVSSHSFNRVRRSLYASISVALQTIPKADVV